MGETKTITATWRAGSSLVFQGVGKGGVPIVIDGDNAAGPGPMESLLIALAGCAGSDIVSILRKKRVDFSAFEIRIEGDRREEYPRRYVAIRMACHFTAANLSREAAEQAVTLSLEKYCSVAASLNPDIAITHDIVIRV